MTLLCLQVKPVVKLLKQTLVGTGVLLVSAVLLFIFATPVEDFIQNSFGTKANSSNVSASKISTKFNLRYLNRHQISKHIKQKLRYANFTFILPLLCLCRKEELLRLPVEVKADDDLAAAAAEAADGRPVYCRDRFYRALAGGQYCKWEDLLKQTKTGKGTDHAHVQVTCMIFTST